MDYEEKWNILKDFVSKAKDVKSNKSMDGGTVLKNILKIMENLEAPRYEDKEFLYSDLYIRDGVIIKDKYGVCPRTANEEEMIDLLFSGDYEMIVLEHQGVRKIIER